jgi:DNA-binding transcriptional ArsR family regulator
MVTSTADPWQALADPTRRRVFARVVGGPCSVTEIARDLPVSRPAVSQHLRVLLDARLVDVQQQGRMRLYEMRAGGLDEMRRELDSYWRKTLTNFKDLAERTYPPTAEGAPPR